MFNREVAWVEDGQRRRRRPSTEIRGQADLEWRQAVQEVSIMIKKILLAVDASELSHKAVSVTAEVASKVGAEVEVLHVFEAKPVPLAEDTDPMAVMPEAKAVADQIVAEAVSELERSGVTATGEITDTAASTARQIIDAASSARADLIVMGSRGLSDLSGMLVGSTAHKVIHLAHCPVLVVR